MSNGSLQNIIGEWLQFLSQTRRYSKHTITAYQQDILNFCGFLTRHQGSLVTLNHLETLSLTTLRSWLSERQQQELSPRSTARALSTVKSFFRYLQHSHTLNNTAITLIRAPRLAKKLPRPLNVDQTIELIDNIETGASAPWIGYRDRALFMLLYATGMRISEALSLKASDLPLGSHITITGKGNKQRLIPLLTHVITAIDQYSQRCPYPLTGQTSLFLGAKGGALQPGIAQKALRDYRRSVGLPETLTPHALRHTCATHLMAETHDLRSIQELLGHASITSTQIYTNLDQQQLLKTYKQFHPRQTLKKP